MIEKRRAKGWQIVFLGADQDAITVAAGMGIDRETSLAYTSRATGKSMSTLARMMARGSESGKYGFTDAERKAAVEDPDSDEGVRAGAAR